MSLLPLVIYFAAVILLAAAMLGISYLLGGRHREPQTGEPYESGILSTGSARVRLTVGFYVVSLLFVIFDLEAAFLFAWAVSARDVGWAGWIGAAVFAVILTVGLVYEWRQGALDWGWSPTAEARARAAREASALRKRGSS